MSERGSTPHGEAVTPAETSFPQKLRSNASYLRACYADLSQPEAEVIAVKLEECAALLERAPVSETGATALLKEVRPYLDMIAPSISETRPLVMVQTKCDAEALAKRIDAFTGGKS